MTMRLKARRVILAVGALAMAAVMVGSSSPAVGAATAATVRATNNRTWSPKTKSVESGTKVVWKNPSNENHNISSYGGGWSKSASLSEGDRTSFRFNNNGTFKFRCTIHSDLDGSRCEGMCGKVKVS
jgi:plastocyanin